MARLEYINYTPTHLFFKDGKLQRRAARNESQIARLPQLFWQDGTPWREANLWAQQRATESTVDIKTVISQAGSLAYYASWLEKEQINWWDFPARKADRCLIRFRGELIRRRDSGSLAPSTTAKRMRDVISLYRWLSKSKLLVPEWPMWTDKQAKLIIQNKYGFERTMTIPTTDLAIKNGSRPGERLEDGLLPVSAADRDVILTFAREHASTELYLLLTLGFYTGMRIGTLCDLKIQTLNNAVPDPAAEGLYRLNVGPGAVPSVSTKHGVTGQVWITKMHLEVLSEYYYSTRRLLREAKASPEHKSNIFLTRFGNPYIKLKGSQSSAINVEMHSIRKKASAHNIKSMSGFHFHQSRCTYATELAKLIIPIAGSINALAIIKHALLHKDEATTLKYIKFVERSPAKIAFANEFTKSFLKIQSAFSEMRNDA
ncbi:TPA: site-specific integrase [Pseudomonas aeruginosa]|nr:site-specific integrase [Pseudomonas aeruginosa]HDQ4722639.1 site-specific integrase [Pseudomonas aeruginosa]